MTERVRLQMKVSEMGFLRKIKGGTMFNNHRNTAIRESLDIESLLLIERSQLRWFGHVSKMPHERLSKQAKVSGKRPVGRPRTRWLDYIKVLVGTVWDFIQAKCSCVG